MGDVAYQRIGARAVGFGSAYSLWLGSDHVLQVTAALGVESYRRWYLREIQAVIVRRTGKRAAWNVIWGILCGLAAAAVAGFAGLVASSGKEHETQVVLQVFGGIAAVFAVGCGAVIAWNSLLGPTCVIFVQTPAGLQPLAAPTRRRAADALLLKLRPLIEEAQLKNQNLPSA